MPNKTKDKLKISNFRIAPFLLLGIVSGIFIANCKTFAALMFAILIISCCFALALFFTSAPKGIVLILAITVVIGSLSAVITHYAYMQGIGDSATNTVIEARVKGITYDFEKNEYTEKVKGILVDSLIVQGDKYKGEAYLDKINSDIDVVIGSKIRITGDIETLIWDTDNSYSMKLFNDRIFYKINAADIQLEQGNNIKIAEKIRGFIYQKLNSNMGERIAGFCYSMLFGDKTYLYPYDKQNFQLAGTAHIFAVSGLHVGVFTAVLLFILKRCKTKSKINLLIVASVLSVYAWLASFSPSVIRAGVMAVAALSAKAFGRRNDLISTVSLTAAMLLALKPYWLYDISFLLSFSAVFGIVLLYKPIYKQLKKIKFFGQAASVNLAVNIGILPLIILFFGYFSMLTLPINLIIIPIASIVYVLSLMHVVISTILPFMEIFAKAAATLAQFCLDLTSANAQITWAIVKIALPLTIFIPYYLTMFLVSDYSLIKRGNKLIILSLIVISYGLVFIFI